MPTEAIVDLGISLVPEGRRLFPKLTVEENLLLGAFRKAARAKIAGNLAFCFDAFPRLAERKSQLAGSMSGGEQQMLALARALMASPRILLVDEPSVGLAPILVARMIDKIAELKAALGLTVLMAEQNFEQATRIADRGYVLVHGQVALAANNIADLATATSCENSISGSTERSTSWTSRSAARHRRGERETLELGTLGQGRPDRHAEPRRAGAGLQRRQTGQEGPRLRHGHPARQSRAAERAVRRSLEPDPHHAGDRHRCARRPVRQHDQLCRRRAQHAGAGGNALGLLGHVFYDGKTYNGHSAGRIDSGGVHVLGIEHTRDKMVGRGVLLDVARYKGVDWLEDGYGISNDELDATAEKQGVRVEAGDFVIIRTGQMERCLAEQAWGGYAGGDAPGVRFENCYWCQEKQIAAICSDTWGVEVRPNETDEVNQPWHWVVIPAMGLTMGEMFFVKELAEDCAGDRVYEFMFCGPPLVITGGTGSPINPLAIK